MKILKNAVHSFGRWYCRKISRREYESQRFMFKILAVEYSFLFRQLVQLWPSRVLDVGTGTSALPNLISRCGFVTTAIDNVKDYWTHGMFNRHFHVINDDIKNTRLKNSYECICCISVLEHIREHSDAMRSMFSLLSPGGHIVLTFPYNDSKYVENVYALPGASYGQNFSYICQVYSRKQVEQWLYDNGGVLVEQEFWQAFSGEFWTIGDELSPPRRVSKTNKHQITCLLIKKRDEN